MIYKINIFLSQHIVLSVVFNDMISKSINNMAMIPHASECFVYRWSLLVRPCR